MSTTCQPNVYLATLVVLFESDEPPNVHLAILGRNLLCCPSRNCVSLSRMYTLIVSDPIELTQRPRVCLLVAEKVTPLSVTTGLSLGSLGPSVDALASTTLVCLACAFRHFATRRKTCGSHAQADTTAHGQAHVSRWHPASFVRRSPCNASRVARWRI